MTRAACSSLGPDGLTCMRVLARRLCATHCMHTCACIPSAEPALPPLLTPNCACSGALQGQLFETRTLVKQAALGEANGTAERGGSMRALDRAVSKVVSDDVDSAVLASLKQE